MTKSIIQWAVAALLTAPLSLSGQVVVGGETPDPSAVLDVQSTSQGMLLPRMTGAQRDAVSNPATGLTIFNTTTNCLETNLGTPAVPDWVRMKCRSAVVQTLDCSSAVVTGSLTVGESASGVSADVPYTGGNSSVYDAQSVTSTGVTGLTASLSAGSLASGAGTLTWSVTGTPASGGTASFALSIGGQTCTMNVFVCTTGCCAKVSATEYKNYMCYNVGAANTSADPFTPTWEIHGGYWQWGRLAQAAAGPTGPDTGQANDGAVSGWNTTNAANGSWADGSKSANDPCPTGYRVPTRAQWDGVVANNIITNLGAFSSSPTNYGAGRKFGDQLMLPAPGARSGDVNGVLFSRGANGAYWSSTESGSSNAWHLVFNSSFAGTSDIVINRNFGISVRCIEDTPGAVGALDCSGATITGTLTPGQAASGVSASVPYTGGNGGFHSGQTVSSTGVTGLTATLSAGNFGSGAGNLSYAITGTPASGGTASFALNIGGQTCTLDVTVSSAPVCRAKVNATDFKNFMCYNLGAANTSADPITPSWEINGGYWQWGRLARAAAGPTGPGTSQANDGAVSGWSTTGAANGSWADGSKTGNDPCPVGYRVPTRAQWDGVLDNNTITNMGSFSDSATNYGVGVKFGDQLMLPAAGLRNSGNGVLSNRGNGGSYWSSTEISGSSNAVNLYSNSSGTGTSSTTSRSFGRSVRCIEDTPGAVGALDCSGATITGTLTPGQAASGVSASVPYTGGNGGFHSGQTVTSTGVTGLTATLSAGNFGSGAGNLSYAITGTPASDGTASFALSIGGQTCTINMAVTYLCRAKVNATDYKNFMCYNLGAANTSADPFTPSWEINGGYWQWGRSAEAAAGPTATDPKDGAVSGWNTTDAANGDWADGSKTTNDPCPTGYRVPTKAQWDGVLANNTITNVGTFSNSATNYGAGKKFGDQLMLPAAGLRYFDNGALGSRGSNGFYWSSTEYGNGGAWGLNFSSSDADTSYGSRTYGLSVRCVAE